MRISDWSSDVCSSDLGVANVAPVERFDGGTAEEAKGAVEVGAEDLQHALHPGLARGEGEDPGPADHRRAGAQGDGAGDVGAAADAPVAEHPPAVADGVDDLHEGALGRASGRARGWQ